MAKTEVVEDGWAREAKTDIESTVTANNDLGRNFLILPSLHVSDRKLNFSTELCTLKRTVRTRPS